MPHKEASSKFPGRSVVIIVLKKLRIALFRRTLSMVTETKSQGERVGHPSAAAAPALVLAGIALPVPDAPVPLAGPRSNQHHVAPSVSFYFVLS